MKKLLEAITKFAGEPEQKPGDQVKGTDKAVSKGKDHPFKGKLVGASESIINDLEKVTEEKGLEWQLAEQFAQFKESVQPDYPDSRAGVLQFIKNEIDPQHVATELKPEECRIIPDSNVEGVWLVENPNTGFGAIIYMAGYKDPWGDIRKTNDFESLYPEDLNENVDTLDVDEQLTSLRNAYRTLIASKDSYSDHSLKQASAVYEQLRSALMKGDLDEYKNVYNYVSGKYTDGFDLLMDIVIEQGGRLFEENFGINPKRTARKGARPARGQNVNQDGQKSVLEDELEEARDRDSEYNANMYLSRGFEKMQPGHYLKRGDQILPKRYASSDEAYRAWQGMPEHERTGVKLHQVKESIVKNVKRKLTGKDLKSRVGQEIGKSFDAMMTGDNKAAKKHFRNFDRLDRVGEGWESGPEERAPRRERDPDAAYDQARQEKLDAETKTTKKYYVYDGVQHKAVSKDFDDVKDAVAARDAISLNKPHLSIQTRQFRVNEGYTVVPDINKERYTDLSHEGLEGPFRAKNGEILYYDPRAGKYYNRDSDMYVDYGLDEAAGSKSPFQPGDYVYVRNYQGKGRIHSIPNAAEVRVILPNNLRVEVPISDLRKTSVAEDATDEQRWEKLRDAYSAIKTIDPSSPTYQKLIDFLEGLSTEDLQSLANANIRFISGLARNRVNRRAKELSESWNTREEINAEIAKAEDLLDQAKLDRNSYAVRQLEELLAELSKKRAAMKESRGHKVIASKLKDIEARNKPISDEQHAKHIASLKKQKADYLKKNPQSIYKQQVDEYGATAGGSAAGTTGGGGGSVNAKSSNPAATAATTALKTATGSTAPAPQLAKAIDAASKGQAMSTTDAKTLEPLMKNVASLAQDPNLANQFKPIAQKAKQFQQTQQQNVQK